MYSVTFNKHQVFEVNMVKEDCMAFKRITFTLPEERIKQLKKMSEKYERNHSNMISFLISISDECLSCYYCNNRKNCPIKNNRSVKANGVEPKKK